MVELDIIHTVTSDDITNEKTPMQEINEALKSCKFGKFHIKMIITSFMGAVAGVSLPFTTSFLLPVAECDLDMDLIDKGMLNASPFVGMLFSNVLAGFLTDTFGRLLFLKLGFGGVFLFSIIAGSSQSFEVLLIANFFQGTFFAIAVNAHVIYTPEFCHNDIRDRVVICQASFIALGQIIAPLMTWGILSQDWNYTLFDGYIVLHTWNFYLYISSLWSFFACVLYSILPESPKYLVTRQRYDEAREILIKMYKENTGKSAESYPHIDIWKNLKKPEAEISENTSSIAHQLVQGLRNVKPMFQKPLVFHLAVLSSSMSIILAIYNVLRLWFPQLSTIVEHYEMDGNQDLCVLLDRYTSETKMRGDSMNNSTDSTCIPKVSGAQTYINSIIVGTVCLFPYLISGALVSKVGKKALLLFCGVTSMAIILGMRYANSKIAVVALFASGIAISQLMKGLTQAVAVEMFPTQLRSFSISLVLMSGRLSTLIGNLGFALLLDLGCEIPFFAMSGMMFCVTILLMFTPKKKV